jgi:protein TonB
MSKLPQKTPKFLDFRGRFLVGLILSLSLVLMAFEYTVERSNDYTFGNPIVDHDGEELPPITLRKEVPEKPQPKPETKTNQIKIVENLPPEKPIEKEPKPKETEPFEFNPESYGMNIPEKLDEAELPRSSVEVFPHTNACAGLEGEELKNCSLQDIVNMIKERFVVPEILNDIGGRQGAEMSFIINEEGSVEQIETVQETHTEMGKASKAAISKLPTFVPPSHHGKKVKLIIKVPIVVSIK